MSITTKIWHDETAFVSKFDNLNFSIDSLGVLSLRVIGDKNNTHFNINITINGESKLSNQFNLKDGETRTITYYIVEKGSLSITGEISAGFALPPYSGRIEAIYNTNYQVSNWHDKTAGISYVENLYLISKNSFKNPQLVLQGKNTKKTKCMLSILFNGDVLKNFQEELNNENQIIIDLDKNSLNKKGSLQVFGFIQNESLLDADANISLFESN